MTHKSLLTAYLLWLFTGVFGGHRFYLGHIKSAFIYLLLCIINLGIFGYILSQIFEEIPFGSNQNNITPALRDSLDVIAGIMGVFSIIQGIFLAFDFFWTYFATRKQNKGYSQYQVKVFD